MQCMRNNISLINPKEPNKEIIDSTSKISRRHYKAGILSNLIQTSGAETKLATRLYREVSSFLTIPEHHEPPPSQSSMCVCLVEAAVTYTSTTPTRRTSAVLGFNKTLISANSTTVFN